MDVSIVEVAPRDGLQNESTVLPTASKVELVARSVEAGLKRVEAVSFVRPDAVPQMADAEAVMDKVPRLASVSYSGLVLNQRGLDRALAAGVDEVNLVVLCTETFSRRNQGMSVSESVRVLSEVCVRAKEAGLRTTFTLSAAFGCPFEGEVAPPTVLRLLEQVLAAGPDEVDLADTIGVGVPARVRAMVQGCLREAPELAFRAHFHNTRNTGLANALAAVEVGVSVLDASTGGIGGCPFAPAATGNIATEDLLYLLHRSGYSTGVDPATVAATGTWLGGELGLVEVPALLGRAGCFPPA